MTVRNTQQALLQPSGHMVRGGVLLMVALRFFFVLALGAVGWGLASEQMDAATSLGRHKEWIMVGVLATAVVVILLDMIFPRKSLAAISGVFFGLIVGIVIAFGLGLIVDLLIEVNLSGGEPTGFTKSFVSALKLAIGVICCYLAVSVILQTQDDIRFVIPYVEFAKEMKGNRPLVLDTSAIIDGRISDIADTRILESELLVPRFVLHELQTIADSSDKLKRTRGRRGLDMLNKLQSNENIDIRILEVQVERGAADACVDDMLVDVAMQLDGKVVTNDFNLNKVAQLRGVTVININDLANALKPVVLPGEPLSVKVIKPGEEVGQGIGYLDDGTMVVAEGGRDCLGEVVQLTVTSVLQTSAGRMIFGRLDGSSQFDRKRQHRSDHST